MRMYDLPVLSFLSDARRVPTFWLSPVVLDVNSRFTYDIPVPVLSMGWQEPTKVYEKTEVVEKLSCFLLYTS